MSYIIEQKVKQKTYVYQVDSYWDKDKKQPRQRRTYLGRKDEITGEIVTTQKSSKPKGSYSFGSLYFLMKITRRLKLSNVLRSVFPEHHQIYLALAFFKVIEAEPYYLYEQWQEDHYFFENSSLTSQRISELLSELGQNEKAIEQFFSQWIKRHNTESAILFDVTSISSYSGQNDLLEFGYNRDKERLQQVNIGIVSREGSTDNNVLELPLVYRIYSGSIPDVVTLKNVISLIDTYGLNLSCFVMDKGFYSQQNIKELNQKGFKVLIPLPFSTSMAKKLINDFGDEINSPLHAFSYNNKVYFHLKKRIKVGTVTCTAHLYLDKEKKAREETKFMQIITELEKTFGEKNFKNRQKAQEYISETIKSKKKFFLIRKTKGKFIITRNSKVIAEELSVKGKFILLSNNHDLQKDGALQLYRSKDSIEKIFLSMKHAINEKRFRTKSISTMQGSIFINFLSLILLSYIDQIMTEKNLYKKYSKKELFKTLNKLKVFELANGQVIKGEVSKRQKTIFSAFGLSKDIQPSYN